MNKWRWKTDCGARRARRLTFDARLLLPDCYRWLRSQSQRSWKSKLPIGECKNKLLHLENLLRFIFLGKEVVVAAATNPTNRGVVEATTMT